MIDSRKRQEVIEVGRRLESLVLELRRLAESIDLPSEVEALANGDIPPSPTWQLLGALEAAAEEVSERSVVLLASV